LSARRTRQHVHTNNRQGGGGRKIAASNASIPARRDKLSKTISQAVLSLFATSWCDSSQPWLFGTWEETHIAQRNHSLRWHEVLPPLHEALRAVALDRKPVQKLGFGAVYSFGLASPGDTPAMLHRAFPRSHIYGFDSFQGLPAEEDHAPSRVASWRRGAMRPRPETTPGKIVASAGGKKWMTLIIGPYSDTLGGKGGSLTVRHRLGRALYVDIDVSLHSSAALVLTWLVQQRVLRVGTLVGYESFWSISCHRYHVSSAPASSHGQRVLTPLELGVGLAHAEATSKFGLRWQCVAGPCKLPQTIRSCHPHNNWAPVFMLTQIGAAEPDTGFEFERREVVKWMNAYPVCGTMRDL